jgi:hypothetical protein
LINKVIQDGYVAVITSAGYGKGWSTWHRGNLEEYTQMVFDPAIVELIKVRDNTGNLTINSKIKNYCQLKYNFAAHDLVIEWVKESTRFTIVEYDGDEYLITENNLEFTA